MSGACAISPVAGAVRSVLWAVDCNTREFARRGYEALAGGAQFQAALTAALTIYIALVGYRLLFAPDGARLSDGPRMALKVGAILALVSSWGVFQTLVFDLARQAPAEIAAVIAGPSVGGREALADPVGGLQVAYDELFSASTAFARDAAAQAKPEPPAAGLANPDAETQRAEQAARDASAGRSLAAADTLLLIVHAGVAAASSLAIEVLGALGPLFLALSLFRQTRGFFVGWVRALSASALMTAGGWVLILLMLRVLDPWLIALDQQRELAQLDARSGLSAAAIVEVFAAAQAGMILCAGAIAFAFRLDLDVRPSPDRSRPALEPGAGRTPAELTTRAGLLADQLRRFDQILETRDRTAQVGAAAAPSSSAAARRGAAAGAPDTYRRPAAAVSRGRAGGRS